MPIERTVTGPAITAETSKRPDVLSRANYGQQLSQIAQQLQQMQPVQSQLASIKTPMPPVTPPPTKAAAPAAAPREERAEVEIEQIAPEPDIAPDNKATLPDKMEQPDYHQIQQILTEHGTAADIEEALTDNNAMLLDIVQSLPPMPALTQQPQSTQSQSIQSQPLNGRATRSLGKVLLDGHLVPQDRLEVAQNIQRMLRGVDLNYQLGEILLMFKLLTPDQLLAASLVSYGLITTTQISALGRIRQELHAIGLEYDLENLLVLFRILTPEQLREVRASLQS